MVTGFSINGAAHRVADQPGLKCGGFNFAVYAHVWVKWGFLLAVLDKFQPKK